MGCSSHGPVSTKMFRMTGEMSRDMLEMCVMALTDMRMSEIPKWADRDWWRQTAIDWIAADAGEIPESQRPKLGKRP